MERDFPHPPVKIFVSFAGPDSGVRTRDTGQSKPLQRGIDYSVMPTRLAERALPPSKPSVTELKA